MAPLEPDKGWLVTGRSSISRTPTSLVPSLDSSSDGVENNGQIQKSGVSPFMSHFFTQDSSIFIIELMDGVDTHWVLRNKCALDKVILDVLKTELGREFANILEEFGLGDTDQRILDSWLCEQTEQVHEE